MGASSNPTGECDIELDNPLRRDAWTMLRIGPDFVDPIDDDVPTDEERQLCYSDDESEEDEQSNDGDTGDDYSDDEGAHDNMIARVPFD